MSKYKPGEGCDCAARCEHECACHADWTESEVYELRARVKDLEKQISAYNTPIAVRNPTPCQEYKGLLKQFIASINIVNSQDARIRLMGEKLTQNDLKKHLASIENLNSEREMNAQLTTENEALRDGIKAVRELIDNSGGVDGLALNGDILLWSDLEQGGTFEEWLLDFNKAESYLVV